MGTIIQQNFGAVGDLILDMNDGQKWNLYQLLQHCDDDTWEFYDENRNRQNRIGAHMFKSKNQFSKDRGKTSTSSVDRMFDAWVESGWIRDANSVPDLKDDPIYLRHYGHLPKNKRPVHYVFNVYWLCNLLDLRATMKAYKITEPRHDSVLPLLPLALKPNEEKFRHPPVKSFLDNYKPRIIPKFLELSRDKLPDRWEDLYEAKKESAGEGAGAKVETDSERTSESTDQLSSIDVITSDDEFAKVVDDLFPFTVSILRDDDDFVIEFLPEHINEKGQLDIDLVGVEDEIKEEFFDLDSGPSGRVERFSEANTDVLLAIRRYLDEQREQDTE